MTHHDTIAVVDFGGQYAHLIATKVRRLRVLAEIRQPDDPLEMFAGYRGIILSGSPSFSAFGEDSGYTKAIYDLDIPILGFCFGHQEIAKHYGGEVVHGGREWGRASLHIVRDHPLFAGLAPVEQVFMSHFDSVVSVGEGFEELGYTALGESEGGGHRFAAIGSDRFRRYGFQFHPEVDDTTHGHEMIANFVLGICGCTPSWTMERYLEEQVERVRAQVGDRSVFLLASGGVDSTVAARLFGLAHRLRPAAPAARRQRPDAQGREPHRSSSCSRGLGLGEHLHFVDASDVFLAALDGVNEPERKRADHRRHVRRGVRARGAAARHRGPPARPGDHLPRHDRDGRHEAGRHDQDAPQPRAGDRADDRGGPRGRAARRTLQGGGAGAGRTAGHPARHDLAAPVPGSRPRRPPALLERRRGPRGIRRHRAAARGARRPVRARRRWRCRSDRSA